MEQMNWPTISLIAGLISAWSLLMFGLVRGMLDDDRQKTRRLELDMLSLRAELARDYIRREDWIRTVTALETKMDQNQAAIRAALDDLKGKMYGRP